MTSEAVTIRSARRGEVEDLIAFLIRTRAHISGSRDPAVFRALIADSFGSRPRTTIVVGEIDGALAAGLVAVNGDLPGYYRRLPLRHPRAALALVWHRTRKLRSRLTGRRELRKATGEGPAPHPWTPDVLRDDPRLQQPPRPADGPGPHATDHGPEIAFCLTLVVAPDHRGKGLSRQMVEAALGDLRAAGATRYDCSFAPGDVVASRLYLSMPFDIQRFPAGYFASIDLSDVRPAPLPR